MGSLVEEQTERAVCALKERDISLAHHIVESDERVNDLRYKIENECLRTMSIQQPAARDLRTIIAAMHMAVEMERMIPRQFLVPPICCGWPTTWSASATA